MYIKQLIGALALHRALGLIVVQRRTNINNTNDDDTDNNNNVNTNNDNNNHNNNHNMQYVARYLCLLLVPLSLSPL